MKAVHFGAGNIGRGFIGVLLSRSGYEVCFVARNEKTVRLLQQNQRYKVTLANADKDTTIVNNVTAICNKDRKEVEAAVAEADLVTTAVGVGALEDIAPSIAAGISLRLKQDPDRPLHVIACENFIGGSTLLRKYVYRYLPQEHKRKAGEVVAFPNTTVDRIVPVQQHEDPLQVTVEPYYEWVIDGSQLLEELPIIHGAQFADKLEPYIERKLFTVNTGHCTAAYLGYLEGYETIQEVMSDIRLRRQVQRTLEETGDVLTTKYHWNPKKHRTYIRKIMERFENPKLRDSVVRVGRSPIRKLSPQDRLLRPAVWAARYGYSTNYLTSSISAALLFDYSCDEEAVKLQSLLKQGGINLVMERIMGLSSEEPLYEIIKSRYRDMKKLYGVMAEYRSI